jgi:hypothetical protein
MDAESGRRSLGPHHHYTRGASSTSTSSSSFSSFSSSTSDGSSTDAGRVLLEWPRVYVQVISVDAWGRHRAVGYGYFHLPDRPGTEMLRVWGFDFCVLCRLAVLLKFCSNSIGCVSASF